MENKFTPDIETPGHLYQIFEPETHKARVDRMVMAIEKFDSKTPFDAIAYSGMSGAGLAFPISYLTGKPLMCIRKEGDTTQSSSKIDGVGNARTYVIVDDCIDSGRTILRIRDTVRSRMRMDKAKLLAVFLHYTGVREDIWRKENPDVEVITV